MSTPRHPNAERLREAYADLTRFEALCAPNIVVHAQGSRGIATGDWVGRDTVLQRIEQLWERSGRSYVMTTQDVVANDHFACVLARLQANHPTNHRSMDLQICGVWRFDEDGRLVEHWENCDDWSAFENFFEPLDVEV